MAMIPMENSRKLPIETKPSRAPTERMTDQNCLVRLPAATKASGRCRRQSTRAKASAAKAARLSSSVTTCWAFPSPVNMQTGYGSGVDDQGHWPVIDQGNLHHGPEPAGGHLHAPLAQG